MSKFLALILLLTSLLLTSCFKWAARAVNKLPEKTALQNNYDFEGKVVIVGAGASGLAAAKVLEQNNIEYIILEATNQYGGRLKKDTTLADFPIDLGAEWIHSNPKVLNVIKGKSGNQIDEDLIKYKLENAARWDGKKLKPISKSFLNLYYHFMAESKFKSSTWYDFINENMGKDVSHKIVYNSAVNSIDYTGEEVLVQTINGNTYKADRVLVTVSMGVLKSNNITFIPDLSSEKRKAVEGITFHQGFKVALKFSEKFYPDVVSCEIKNGEKTFYDISFKKNTKCNVLGFLCTGNEADKYYTLNSETDIINQLIKELDQIFDGKASIYYTGDYRIENWGQYEFTQGTWTQAFQEKKSNLEILRLPMDNKVYFAGEIYDIYQQMGVPGAILSGYYSIDQLLTN